MEKSAIRFSKFQDQDGKVRYTLIFDGHEAGLTEYQYEDENDHLKWKQKVIDKASELGFTVEPNHFKKDFLDGTEDELPVFKK
jgi:hypothetical protein